MVLIEINYILRVTFLVNSKFVTARGVESTKAELKIRNDQNSGLSPLSFLIYFNDFFSLHLKYALYDFAGETHFVSFLVFI